MLTWAYLSKPALRMIDIFLLMGIGYMFKKQPLKGSCGGVANLMGDERCSFCGDDPNKCDSVVAEQQDTALKAAQLGKSV